MCLRQKYCVCLVHTGRSARPAKPLYFHKHIIVRSCLQNAYVTRGRRTETWTGWYNHLQSWTLRVLHRTSKAGTAKKVRRACIIKAVPPAIDARASFLVLFCGNLDTKVGTVYRLAGFASPEGKGVTAVWAIRSCAS